MLPNVLHSLERLDLRDSAIFDADWYRAAYADVSDCTDPVQHFLDMGWAQRRAPNAFMDPTWYLARYPEVRDAGTDPLLHYMQSGWREGYDPSPWFSTARYCDANPDVHNAAINPLLHFLRMGRAEGRAPLGPSSLDLNTSDMRIWVEDFGSATVAQWMAELALHSCSVRPRIIHTRSLLHRAALALEGLRPWRRDRTQMLIVSINGAGLTPRIARAVGRGLVVIFDSMAAAHAVHPGLRNALVQATVATSSPKIAALLAGIPNLAPICYAEPMSGAYFQAGSGERTISVIWRCPSPHSSHGRPPALIRERRAIAHRLAPLGLHIVGDTGWRDRRRPLAAALEVRRDWASFSCARERYGTAKIALVTPPPEQGGEITADILIAMASGALPVAPFTMAQALFDRFGDNCPVPLYKDVSEVVAIVEHYLLNKDERVALVDKCKALLFGQCSYSAAVGGLVRGMTIGA